MSERVLQSYDEAMKFLLEFIDYEKITKYKYDLATFDLRRVVDLMAAVGSPEKSFRSLHVAGTKGKGSTAGMIQSILTAAGFRAGLYTSPHLCRIEERMTIDGEMMTEQEFVEIVNEAAPYTAEARAERPNESPTYFELVTAIGFRHFARRKVDFASVEVGMGGRLDATNIITPEVSVITRIDYDHEERLGHTLDKIAFEKGGIIKPGVPVVCAPQEPEALGTLVEIARRRAAPLTLVGRDCALENLRTGLTDGKTPFCTFDLKGLRRAYPGLTLRLLGEHQALNAACAVAAIEIAAERAGVTVHEAAIRRGLESARGPARLEVFAGPPLTLLDGAHNPASMRALCATLDRVFPGRAPVLLIGVSRDKNAAEMFKLVLPRAQAVVFSRSDSARAAEPEFLATLARESSGVEADICPDPVFALDRARELAGPNGLLCITGSFFLSGMLRPKLLSGG